MSFCSGLTRTSASRLPIAPFLKQIMSLPLPSWPIKSELPAELGCLANHISSYFSSNSPYNNASLGALIFTSPPQPPSLLLIQVSETSDPHAFSCAWEVPSGSPKSEDLTMLYTLARIILEQTGLHLSRVHTMSGSEVGPGTFENGNAQWMKLQFIVQVSELELDSNDSSQHDKAYKDDNYAGFDLKVTKGKAKDVNSVPVLLNQEKHQKHTWVTENDLQEFVNSALFPAEETKQYQSMLDAFFLYQQETVQIQSGLLQSPALSQAQSSSSDSTTFPASGYSTSEPMKPPLQTKKRTPKKKGTKADKARPSSSHFHRFRIS